MNLLEVVLFGSEMPDWFVSAFGIAVSIGVFILFLLALFWAIKVLNLGGEWASLILGLKAFRIQELRAEYENGVVELDRLLRPVVTKNRAVANEVKSQVEKISLKFDEATDRKVAAIASAINAVLPDIDWNRDGKPDLDVSAEEVSRVARYLRDIGFELLDEDEVTADAVPLPPGVERLSKRLQQIPQDKRYVGG